MTRKATSEPRVTPLTWWATVAGAALLALAISGATAWHWSDFMTGLMIESGAALATVAAFFELTQRLRRPPVPEAKGWRMYSYGGPAHTGLAGRWLLAALILGLLCVGVGALGALRGWQPIWQGLLLELGVATAMVGVLTGVEVFSLLADIDPEYRPSRPGQLCHRSDPPSPVRFVADMEGGKLECGHDQAHSYSSWDIPQSEILTHRPPRARQSR